MRGCWNLLDKTPSIVHTYFFILGLFGREYYQGVTMTARILAFVLFVIATTLIAFLPAPSLLAETPVEEGMNISDVSFTTPSSQEARLYLGLKDGTTFTSPEIPAKLVLIEVFHVLCQYCQKQAPEMNRIYQYVEEDPELNKNIKIFSVAIQSEQRSLDAFKKTFRVKFPILSDVKLKTFSALGDPPIPFLLLVDEKGNVLLTHKGYLKSGDDFFRKIKKFYSQNKAPTE